MTGAVASLIIATSTPRPRVCGLVVDHGTIRRRSEVVSADDVLPPVADHDDPPGARAAMFDAAIGKVVPLIQQVRSVIAKLASPRVRASATTWSTRCLVPRSSRRLSPTGLGEPRRCSGSMTRHRADRTAIGLMTGPIAPHSATRR